MKMTDILTTTVVVAAFLFATSALPDVAVESTLRGREAKAALLFLDSDSVVLALSTKQDPKTFAHQVQVLEALKGEARGTIELPRAALPILGKMGTKVGEKTVELTPGKKHLLFLVRRKGGWRLAKGTLWDGYLAGNPKDHGFLPQGGARVEAPRTSETYRTIQALARLDSRREDERRGGIRILCRAGDWGVGKPRLMTLASRKLGELSDASSRARLILELIRDDGGLAFNTGFSWGGKGIGWQVAYRAAQWKVREAVPVAMRIIARVSAKTRKSLRERGSTVHAAYIAGCLGTTQTRQLAIDFLLDQVKGQGHDKPMIVSVLARIGDEKADRQLKAWLDLGGEDGRAVEQTRLALTYFKVRGNLGAGDVKILIQVVERAATGGTSRSRAHQNAALARDFLEALCSKKFRQGTGPGPASSSKAEFQNWARWWKQTGSKDPKYQ